MIIRKRCKHLYYLEGSTIPDKIVRCWKRDNPSHIDHRNWFFTWTSPNTWGFTK